MCRHAVLLELDLEGTHLPGRQSGWWAGRWGGGEAGRREGGGTCSATALNERPSCCSSALLAARAASAASRVLVSWLSRASAAAPPAPPCRGEGGRCMREGRRGSSPATKAHQGATRLVNARQGATRLVEARQGSSRLYQGSIKARQGSSSVVGADWRPSSWWCGGGVARGAGGSQHLCRHPCNPCMRTRTRRRTPTHAQRTPTHACSRSHLARGHHLL